MSAWLLRATVFGVLVVVLRSLLGFGMVYWPAQGGWMRILCLVVLLAAVAAWGLADGRSDRLTHPDERGGADLTIRWLKAGVAGGLASAALSWVADQLPKFDLGDNGLLFELTAGASFIVLLIFVPSMLGVSLGRYLAGRSRPGIVPTRAAVA